MQTRSWRIGRIGTTDVQLHWSIILGFVFFYSLNLPRNPFEFATRTAIIVGIFACIALHEVGHMLMARHFGYSTRSITLWMLGGVAFFDRAPRSGRDQFLVAAAGPFVNLLIAGLLAASGWALNARFGADWRFSLAEGLETIGLPRLNLLAFGWTFLWLNLFLAIFNLIPIYPLDGGQMLRALLTPRLGTQRADQILLVVGLIFVIGLLVLISLQRFWIGLVEVLLLLLAVGTLNPWFREKLNHIWMWALYRGTYYAVIQHDPDRALAYTDKQIARGHQRARHFILRSYLLYNNDELAVAWQAANQALSEANITPTERMLALNNRGMFAWLQHDPSAGLRDLDEALQLDPRATVAYLNRLQILAEAGETDRALADVERVLELTPDSPFAYYYRARIHFELGDLEQAHSDAALVFATDERERVDWPYLEVQHELLNRLPWAEQIAAWGAADGWLPARVQRFLGDTLLVNGRNAEAAAAYTRARAAAPNLPAILLSRAMAHAASGADEQARDDLAQFLATQPNPALRKRALAVLATLDAKPTTVAETTQAASLMAAETGDDRLTTI